MGAAANKLEADKPDQALSFCLRVLKEEPWNEKAGLLGIQAYLKMNNRPAALHLYRELESCLRQEFNLSPMAELQNLYQSITATH